MNVKAAAAAAAAAAIEVTDFNVSSFAKFGCGGTLFVPAPSSIAWVHIPRNLMLTLTMRGPTYRKRPAPSMEVKISNDETGNLFLFANPMVAYT